VPPLLTRGHGVVLADHNAHGAIGFEPASNPPSGPAGLNGSTQLFQNGEIWSVGVAPINIEPDGEDSGTRYPYLPSWPFERLYYDTLRSLIDFATKELDLKAPLRVEFGIVGIKELYLPIEVSRRLEWWEPILKPEIFCRAILKDKTPTVPAELLQSCIRCHWQRPPWGYCGFPPNRPGMTR
jgi:hypothetical protein